MPLLYYLFLILEWIMKIIETFMKIVHTKYIKLAKMCLGLCLNRSKDLPCHFDMAQLVSVSEGHDPEQHKLHF